MSIRTENRIPVVVGITGHRSIKKQDETALAGAVRTELKKLQACCPNSPLVMLNSLAEGSDLLCAEIADELGIPLLAALPRPLEDYEKDFSEAAKEKLSCHCRRADEVFVVPPLEELPTGGSMRDFQFRQAGIYIVSHCHVLLALKMAQLCLADREVLSFHDSFPDRQSRLYAQ